MRRIIAILAAALLTIGPALSGPPVPGDTAARYDVRLLGIKLGEMTLAGRISGGTYVIEIGVFHQRCGRGSDARIF
ncbi:hypothetical protein [Roseovarius pelagicus]|uniref:Uncharacterized protein n=1 Tax=Roseovarius pelagicus TaxID=2980108 RepID=A0ABY6DGK9_9RHOB|nr:hypothetical protein [Roseovarius pelagicus]UXX84363.1 hypothetical protein N7U68_06875 [Roseovarius pelagicus]